MLTLDDVTEWARVALSEILDRPPDEIDCNKTFAQLGVDSGQAMHLLLALEDRLQIELDPDVVSELATIDALAAYALRQADKPSSRR